MKTKYSNGSDCVIVDDQNTPTYETHTSGTSEPLYCGDNFTDAAASLGMGEDTFNSLLMSDPE